ncbi:MAG: lipoyl(octanoyl) transferase LipB [Planctomycetota bacterium]|jgi:lipoyl(octanoyl) transferase
MNGARESVSALRVRDLGRMPYAEALELQRELQQEVIAGRERPHAPMHLLLVEHDPPVITVSRRRTARTHLLAAPERLSGEGVEVVETDRGGDITYHGPGQLVVYPILDLNVLGLRLHSYMRFLEGIVIDTLEDYGVVGHRDPEATGVWVGPGPAARKICAMGVRVSRWVSMHGLALNVTTNLEHFGLIVPCGLVGREVTSLEQELGAGCPSMDDVKRAITDRFVRRTAPDSA